MGVDCALMPFKDKRKAQDYINKWRREHRANEREQHKWWQRSYRRRKRIAEKRT